METKCNINHNYFISSPDDSDTRKFLEYEKICDGILEVKSINNYNSDLDKSIDIENKNIIDICDS